MCKICSRAKHLSRDAALRYLAEEMKRAAPPDCVDKLIGKLVGVEDLERDVEADADWEKVRR